MTIRKGVPWGEPGILESTGVVVHSDAEASAAVSQARLLGLPLPTLGLLGGDLCATLGGGSDAGHLRGNGARRYPIDLGVALIDGVEHCFVAHLIVRQRFWRGRIVAAMNAQWLGGWDLGPRSHPNDGLLDISDARLGLADKLAAHRRVRTGTHVPHPAIEVVRTRERHLNFARGGRAFVDGVAVGSVTDLELSVEADALTIVI